MSATVFLIPSLLAEGATASLSPAVLAAVQTCEVVFAENIRTTRRFFKSLDRSVVIDQFEWHEIDIKNTSQSDLFRRLLCQEKKIAIISEAGCPGIADPGQHLVSIAHQAGARVKPITGPSSILLALMGSGLNGQRFSFHGYLPIDSRERSKMLRNLEELSDKEGSSCIFIETPYRNNALFRAILECCKGITRLCIAANLTSEREMIRTRSVSEWKKTELDLHKQPVIYILQSGNALRSSS